MKRVFIVLILLIPFVVCRAQLLQSVDLSGTWQVTWNGEGHGPQLLTPYLYSDPLLDPARYVDVPVPMELNLALQRHGLVEDINFGLNVLKARWVAEQYWQYVKRFNVPAEALKGKTWLVFDQLDLNATILLNSQVIGTHHSAFVPCRIDVTGKLKAGENLLQVAVESGLYGVADKDGGGYQAKLRYALDKRMWMRKPQYQFAWDWNPKLINVGITGPVRLEWTANVRLDQVVVQCKLTDDLQQAILNLKCYSEAFQSEPLRMRVTVQETGDTLSKDFQIAPGMNALSEEVVINNPRLWWPAGQGEQALYHLKVELLQGEQVVAVRKLRTGVRSIRVDQSPHPQAGSYFTIVINNRKIFMKGGNWGPPDMVYSNVKRDRLEKLTDMAVQANFNMLRIWGGAIWAGHDLLDLCDEKGIVVWHDLLFACSKYPGDELTFYNMVKDEVRWGVREFSPHVSLILWCGNNENEVGTFFWDWDKYGKVLPDYYLYHHTFPIIVREEDPSRPYWPSSPFSPNYLDPNDPLVGDQHPWNVSLGETGPDFWAYRTYVDRFPNEGGVLGASSLATLRQFLPPNEQFIRSFSWDFHDNEVNLWSIHKGINYKMVEFWFGKQAEDMGFEKYALGSALLQSEGLQEYIANYRRRMFSTSSAVFWMYNDSWPATHGWTIVDYYLRKKLAYYPVQRAYKPVTTVVALENDSVKIFGVNDGPLPWKGSVRYGICGLQGSMIMDTQKEAVISANTSVLLAAFPAKQWAGSERTKSCAFALLVQGEKLVAQHRLFTERFKDLAFSKPVVRITRGKGTVTFYSDTFVWGACIDINGEQTLPDNCFDILPGISYTIPWTGKDAPKILFTGNSLFY